MIEFPNCKINIGLWITNRLQNGYHHLQTLMYPIPWRDMVEVIPSQGQTSLSLSGIELNNKVEDNLCYKAWLLMHRNFQISPVQMHLHKNIPSGAGLGGGSADAVSVLRQLNTIFKLDLSKEQLALLAADLGMDCPFFIYNKPMLASSKGELLEEVEVSLDGYFLVVVKPDIHVITAEAYSMVVPTARETGLTHFITKPIETWKDQLQNDFEKSVFDRYPSIAKIKETLYNAGAAYASMSGSGSAVYGLFKNETHIEFAGHRVFAALLGSDFK